MQPYSKEDCSELQESRYVTKLMLVKGNYDRQKAVCFAFLKPVVKYIEFLWGQVHGIDILGNESYTRGGYFVGRLSWV